NLPTKFTVAAESVLERKLKSDHTGNPSFRSAFYTGKLSLYLGHKFDIYGLAGFNDAKIHDFVDSSYIIETKLDAVIGGGLSCVLYELEFLSGILRLGFDAKYRQFETKIDALQRYREDAGFSSDSLTFREWQASLGLAYQYKKFIPYIGVKYSDMDAQIEFVSDGTSYSEDGIKSKDLWGLFYGIDVLLCDNCSLNLEARHFDENAVNVGMNLRF
ncbi:MAG: hypothetical protein PHO42_06325, partial [Candidatus Omnitrophica bacterium]|nr:hypothetical protein [Candidatus Omnitrophota bacterium]